MDDTEYDSEEQVTVRENLMGEVERRFKSSEVYQEYRDYKASFGHDMEDEDDMAVARSWMQIELSRHGNVNPCDVAGFPGSAYLQFCQSTAVHGWKMTSHLNAWENYVNSHEYSVITYYFMISSLIPNPTAAFHDPEVTDSQFLDAVFSQDLGGYCGISAGELHLGANWDEVAGLEKVNEFLDNEEEEHGWMEEEIFDEDDVFMIGILTSKLPRQPNESPAMHKARQRVLRRTIIKTGYCGDPARLTRAILGMDIDDKSALCWTFDNTVDSDAVTEQPVEHPPSLYGRTPSSLRSEPLENIPDTTISNGGAFGYRLSPDGTWAVDE